jgi:Ser/Thr protein kinase RdoA (MazF antagonist)
MAPPKKPFAVRKDGWKTRRLAAVARAALAAYDLPAWELRPLAINQNWMYRLDAADGRRFVVRVNRPGMRTPLDVSSEMAWLAALARDTDLVVPVPLADREGRHVQVLDGPDGESYPVSVFGWIEGRNVGDLIDPKLTRAMGAALGRLQQHADTFRPPAPFTTSTLDDVWAFGGRPALLDGDHPLFPPARRELVLRAAERGQARIDALHARPGELRFLHIDLHMGNVRRLPGGRIALLDFDDSRWAHPVQDYAIPIHYFWHRDDGDALWDAFAAGYASVRGEEPAPRAHVRDLIAARQCDLISFVLRTNLLGADALPAWLERVEQRLVRLEALQES